MIQIIICDDEPDVVELITNKLETIIGSRIKYTYFKTTNPKEVIQLIKEKNIDLLLIDIEMPEMNRFEVIKEARILNNNIFIIFITNMDLYVYESLKYRPFRFIRKSHLEEIEEALSSIALLLEDRETDIKIKISKTKYLKMNTDNIIYFESIHNDVKLVALKGDYTFRATLKAIEAELVIKGFVRIHSGYLLNLKYVHLIKQKDVEIYFRGDKKSLPVSRGRRKKLISEYSKKYSQEF